MKQKGSSCIGQHLRLQKMNAFDVLTINSLCGDLVGHVSIRAAAKISRTSKEGYATVKVYVHIYALVKQSWAKRIQIKGWSASRIKHISGIYDETGIVLEPMRELFRKEICRMRRH